MTEQLHLIDLTADIVSAFVGNNAVRSAELPELIAATFASLADIAAPKPAEAPTQLLTPAVSVKKSIHDDYLVCLDDGRKFKSLRRHLGSLGMTPDQYRTKWGLPGDYPMVAPGYAMKRSELARAHGLGRKARAVGDAIFDTALSLTIGETKPVPSADESLSPQNNEQISERAMPASPKRLRAAAKSSSVAVPETVTGQPAKGRKRPAKKAD